MFSRPVTWCSLQPHIWNGVLHLTNTWLLFLLDWIKASPLTVPIILPYAHSTLHLATIELCCIIKILRLHAAHITRLRTPWEKGRHLIHLALPSPNILPCTEAFDICLWFCDWTKELNTNFTLLCPKSPCSSLAETSPTLEKWDCVISGAKSIGLP